MLESLLLLAQQLITMRSLISFLFSIIILFCTINVAGQTGSISGIVTGHGIPLASASVTLLNGIDSAWIRSELTDEKGNFLFKYLADGKYIVVASTLGYITGSQKVEINEKPTVSCAISLEKENTSLSEVAITAKKPFIEMSLGKLVVNIDGTSVTGATSVLELMRRLPGVAVDMNGNITMQGKAGVLVLIDDRSTYLSGDDLAEYLKTISADEVSQIELITQPGAKYDAAGNTGIINLKLKKNKKEGFNGSVMLSYGMSVYFHRNETLLLNYKVKKLSLSLSGSDMEAIGFADFKENLHYIDPQTGALTSNGVIHSFSKERFSNTAGRFNADYKLSDKIVLGSNVSATYHPNANQTNLSAINTDQVNNITSYNSIINPNGFIRENLTTNLYFKEEFTKTSNLELNFDYLGYSKKEHDGVNNTTYDNQMQLQPYPSMVNSQQNNIINVYSLKADYTNSFKNGMKLEAGLKSSKVTTDNTAAFVVFKNNVWIDDTARSNHFLYKENINAAYASLNKNIGKKWEVRLGLRAEQTIANGVQFANSSRFDKNYTSPFPTAFVSYKMDSSNTIELNYGRRIDRPAYQQLNPFIFYSFEYYYDVGNPNLQPQFTHTMELKHSYKNWLISKLSFASTTDVIIDRLTLLDTTKTVYDISENIASNRYVTFQVIFNKDLFKWWSLNVTGTVCDAEYTGPVNNQAKTVSWYGYSLNTNMQFNLGKGWKMETYAYYTSTGYTSPTQSFSAQSYMEFGVSKKVKDWLLVKFAADDPLNIYQLGLYNRAGTFNSDGKFRYASRYFALSVNYYFGKKQQAEQRDNSLDEAKRIK